MARLFLGVLAGIIAGVIVVGLVETLGHIIWPPPEGNLKDPEFLKSIMHKIPLPAKMAVIVAWGLGVFAGGSVARLITQKHAYAAWIVGTVLLGAGVWTMTQIPHPLWMKFNAVAFTIIGVLLANRVTRAR